MCASYMIKQRTAPRLVTEARVDDFEPYHDVLIVPQKPAPVVVVDENAKPTLKAMRFSLIPRWSKDERPKFATHNARLESIAEKPTWRDAFQKRHCIVPLTHFVEPIYEGEHAGFMVAFHQDDAWLMAAGIWEEWTNRATGEIIASFSIITNDPPPFVAEIGHDRCPVFLNEKAQAEWLTLTSKPADMIEFLKANTDLTPLNVTRHRPMRPGWEKRK